jgi:hypothetical protein
MALTYFLQSGSTLYEMNVLMTATNPGKYEKCSLTGDAIPVS